MKPNRKRTAAAKRRDSAEGRLIDDALNQAVQDAVEQHRKSGLPMAVWEDGKVAWVQPDEVSTTAKGKRQKKRRSARRPVKKRTV